jgi:hypothetical protein
VRWISLLEHIVRKLLLAEASKLPAAPFIVPRTTVRPPTRVRALMRRPVRSTHLIVKLGQRAFHFRFRAMSTPFRKAARRASALCGAPRRHRRCLGHVQRVLLILSAAAFALRRVVRAFPEIVHRYAYAGSPTDFYDPQDPRLNLDVQSPVVAALVCFSDSS